MAKVTIDGTEIEVEEGTNVIEAARLADVHVPHFCYHPSLTIVGQCRMCLVEIEGMPKLQTGCSTTVKDGMKIHVFNEKVDKARKGQMEFLLINHPLDCPICDKAGECPLQDYAFNYGTVTSRFADVKRTYPGMERTPIGPHVIQNMNRCIHCTRCIRFCDEISETSELAFFRRGASTEVGVFAGRPLDNWMSACVTDVCPTGALTTREFRFESRVWDLEATASVCNGCNVGCNLFVGHKRGQIFRFRPRVNPDVNDHWLCDYGRFSHERYDSDRVVVPHVRRDDHLGVSTWSEALDAVESALSGVSGERIAAIASAQLTNEEAYLLKRIFIDHLGSHSVDAWVDPIGPIRMRSKDGWVAGDQAGPNYRGLRDVGIAPAGGRTAGELMSNGAEGIDFLYVTEAGFSERTKDPAVVANLRKARFLVVHSWENHPLADVADVVLPSTIFAEKEGTWTNVQGRVQRIHQAYLPKGQAHTDLEILRRLALRLSADLVESEQVDEIFAEMRENVPQFRSMTWNDAEGSGMVAGDAPAAS